MLYIHSVCFLGAGQAAYSEVLCMFKMLYKNKDQRMGFARWVLHNPVNLSGVSTM